VGGVGLHAGWGFLREVGFPGAGGVGGGLGRGVVRGGGLLTVGFGRARVKLVSIESRIHLNYIVIK
jgi:hypothetical protein